MFNVNTRYNHDRRLCFIRLRCYPFSRTRSYLFFPTADAAFSFQLSIPRISVRLSRFKLSRPRLPIHTGRQKRSHSFYSMGFPPITSHYSSPSVCWLLPCETSQVCFIYIYIYMCVCVVLSISFQTFLYWHLPLTNFYDFRFNSTGTAAIGIHPTKAWLSQLVNFKNATWTWGYFRRTICNKILF